MKCPICASTSIENQAKFRAKHVCFINLDRVKCIDCDLHFAHPMPASQDLNSYNASYHESAHGGSERNQKQKAFFTGLAKTRLNYILSNLSSNNFNNTSILEIGPVQELLLRYGKKNSSIKILCSRIRQKLSPTTLRFGGKYYR